MEEAQTQILCKLIGSLKDAQTKALMLTRLASQVEGSERDIVVDALMDCSDQASSAFAALLGCYEHLSEEKQHKVLSRLLQIYDPEVSAYWLRVASRMISDAKRDRLVNDLL